MSTAQRMACVTAAAALLVCAPGLAQSPHAHPAAAAQDGHAPAGPAHRQSSSGGHRPAHPPGAETDTASRSAPPRAPLAAITDADRAAAFPVLDHAAMQHAPALHGLLRINRLEQWHGRHGSGQAWEADGWIGGDLNRLWLRSEGERHAARTAAATLDVLYGRSLSPWWDIVVGARHAFRPADPRTWAALGVQGLAPYKFETRATVYVGSAGQMLAVAEIEYDVLLTNRLILQPRIEATLAARDEPRRGIGRGLDSTEAGLRLRYEFSRRIAPYLGLVHERLSDNAAAQAGHARDTRWVVGLRTWF